jgi:sugar phosphate permease
MSGGVRTATIAWLITAVYYFYQYTLRSAPAVMMPQLSDAFGMSATAVASLVGLFYYGYSPFSLVAGAAMDRLGPRKVVPLGAATVGVGALLFATGSSQAASIGRLLQGAGGVFALVGAAYIATTNFPASRAATLIGATQMFGMANAAGPQRDWLKSAGRAFLVVFRNPQSILCGMIAGLLFIPTTIIDMIWGVRYLQEARGLDYGSAVIRSATVPLGWIIGCPLLGFLSDPIGRRKPVIVVSGVVLLACLAWILYGRANVFPPYVVGIVAGLASGAAMLPYTVIKEANPPEMSGTATGVVNFLNFTFSALLGPVFAGLISVVGGGAPATLEHYQTTFEPLLYGVALSIVLTFLLKETGPAARRAAPAIASTS